VAATIKAVSQVAAGGGAAMAGAASASVAVLVQDVLRRMMIMKLKTTATCLLFIGLGAAGVILAASQTGPSRPPPAPSRGPGAQPKATQKSAAATQAATKKVQPALQPMENYVVEPPDMILVEVLEALPGRPISGERLVRPDGRIGLGFYGDIPVAGLTLPQIKEKIVLHLRKSLNDETLGLFAVDENGHRKRDAYGRPVLKDPKETDRVFVDVTLYNSQRNYVLGEVASPGHICYTGGDTVLDLIQYAGGLLPTADKARVRLIRSFPKGSPAQVLPVNYEEIAMGTDSSTNYPMLPNDRLVVPRIATSRPGGDPGVGASDGEVPRQDVRAARASASRSAPSVYFDRGAYDVSRKSTADLEKRIEELEKKLDRLIQMVQKSRPRPGERPAAKNGEHPTIAGTPGQAGAVEPQPRRGMTAPDRRPGPRRPAPRRVGPMGPRPPAQPPDQDDPDGSPLGSRADGPGLPDLPPSRPDVLPPSESPPDQ
jgi:polysaccharide biosynthesis/export protein